MSTPLRIQILFESPGRASVQGVDDAISSIDRSLQSAATRAEAAIATAGQRIEATLIRISRVATVQLGTAFNNINGQVNTLISSMQRLDQVRIGRLNAGGSIPGSGGGAGGQNDLQGFLNQQIAAGFVPTGRGTIAANSAGQRTTAEYLNSIGRRLTAAYNSQNELSSVKVGLDPVDPLSTPAAIRSADREYKRNIAAIAKQAGDAKRAHARRCGAESSPKPVPENGKAQPLTGDAPTRRLIYG